MTAEDLPARAPQLARLLLDAHSANIALGLLSPLTSERAESVWLALAPQLHPHSHRLWGIQHGRQLTATVQLVRPSAQNGQERAEVVRLAVSAQHRGAGLGRRLLQHCAEQARAMGIRTLHLTTHAGSDADGFYKRCGWTRLGEIPNYCRRPDGVLTANAFFYLQVDP